MITKLEIFVLSAIQTIYDSWGWFGVAALLTFENATGITPSEIILGLAGWMLISEHQLPPSMIFLGGSIQPSVVCWEHLLPTGWHVSAADRSWTNLHAGYGLTLSISLARKISSIEEVRV